MSKKYDISKSSDLRRFFRDLDAVIMDQVEEVVSDHMGNVCPNCGCFLRLHFGTNVCSKCGMTVEFSIK